VRKGEAEEGEAGGQLRRRLLLLNRLVVIVPPEAHHYKAGPVSVEVERLCER